MATLPRMAVAQAIFSKDVFMGIFILGFVLVSSDEETF